MSMGITFSFTEKFICIESRICAGLSFTNFDIEPIFLDIDVDDAILSQNIKEAMSKSIDILDGKERVRTSKYLLSEEHLEKIQNIRKQRSKDLKKRYGYRRLKDLERDYMYLDVYLIDNNYKFSPYKTTRGGNASGLGIDTYIMLSSESPDKEIGMAARQAMSLCKSIYK